MVPGKGSFYPEYFPDEFVKPVTDSTNYKQYKRLLSNSNIHTLDLNNWFLEIKDTCNCVLYPQYGIHWSYYGMLMATDTIIHYIEDVCNINLPDIEIFNISRSNNLKETDYDIAEGMNLLFQMKAEEMCYAKYKWKVEEGSIRPKVIVIADSFYWGIFNLGIATNSFSLGGFYFYNQQIYPDSFEKPISVSDIDLNERINQNDVIILMTTESNLPKFSWGFVEGALEAMSY